MRSNLPPCSLQIPHSYPISGAILTWSRVRLTAKSNRVGSTKERVTHLLIQWPFKQLCYLPPHILLLLEFCLSVTHSAIHIRTSSQRRRESYLSWSKWRFFEICGPYLCCTTHPLFPLLWIILEFVVVKELKRWSVHSTLYLHVWRHEDTCMGQQTLLSEFSDSGRMEHMHTHSGIHIGTTHLEEFPVTISNFLISILYS